MTKIFLQALNGQTTQRVPFWFMRQAGRYLPEYMKLRGEAGSFLDLCYNPAFAEEVTLQPIRRFDMDAAILFSDILTVPHALGQKLDFIPGRGPVLEAIKNETQLILLNFDDIAFHNHLNPVYETVSRLSKSLPSDKTLIGFAGAPWTVATYMVEGGSSKDFKDVKAFAYGNPAGFQKLMDLLVEATAAYLIRQIDHGAEAIQIFDSWSGVLPEEEFQKWVIAPTKKLIEKIRNVHADIPIIGFPKGAAFNYKDYAEKTGITAIGFDQTLPLSFVRDVLQPLMPVQGGLDNALLLTGGDAMINGAEKIIEALDKKPFIFNLGHGVIKETPPEHVQQLSEYIKLTGRS